MDGLYRRVVLRNGSLIVAVGYVRGYKSEAE